MHKEFQVHKLNEQGVQRANKVAILFDALLSDLSLVVSDGREFAIVKTKLEEACFFAKKSIANQPGNQEG